MTEGEELKRFHSGAGPLNAYAYMYEDPDGDYVRYEDYKRLAAIVGRLREACEEFVNEYDRYAAKRKPGGIPLRSLCIEKARAALAATYAGVKPGKDTP